MLGSALGNLLAPILPVEPSGFWPLLAMGAIVGGTMRAPLTGTIFAIELTGSHAAVVPLLVAVAIAHGFTVLTLRRSILTEKVARRGFHITREYAIDPLEVLFVQDVMQSNVVALPPDATAAKVADVLATDLGRLEPLYFVVENERLVGVATRRALSEWVTTAGEDARVVDMVQRDPTTAAPRESLAGLLARMAHTGLTRMPVVEPGGQRLVGVITLAHTLKAKRRHVEEETRRERVLPIGLLIPSALRPRRTAS
jgi:CBS domain-containing protein